MDLKKKHIEWDMSGEHIEIGGLYNVTGNVLILPITGSGPANITLSEYPPWIPMKHLENPCYMVQAPLDSTARVFTVQSLHGSSTDHYSR